MHTQAAVKVLHQHITHDSLEKFLFEARLAAHLIHPHIIRVLEFGREDNIPFLVMDYAPKGAVLQQINSPGRIEPKDEKEMMKPTQTLFKWRHFEAEILLLYVRWYLRYALSYRDLEEMMAE